MIKQDFQKQVVYICAPYRADTEEGIKKNIEFAVECGKYVLRHGGFPFVPHINTMHLFGLVANDKDVVPYDDQMVIECNTLLVCGERLTSGMAHEIELATRSATKVSFLKSPYEDNKSNGQS